MKKTTLEFFRDELQSTGAYRSSAEHLANKVRKPGALTTLGLALSTASVFPKCSIYEFFHCLTPDKWGHFCFKCIQKAESYGVPVTVEGWNNRKEYKGPVVYVANHMSTFETIMLPAILLTHGLFSTVVKASLSHLPGLEKAAAHMGLIPIGRTNPREDLMTIFNVGCERIAQGQSVLIFSQGKRTPVFARKGWSSIGAKLAEKAKCPMIPIAVKTDIMPTRPNGKGFFKDFGTVDTSKDVRACFGPVITGTSREMHEQTFDWICRKLEIWQMPTKR